MHAMERDVNATEVGAARGRARRRLEAVLTPLQIEWRAAQVPAAIMMHTELDREQMCTDGFIRPLRPKRPVDRKLTGAELGLLGALWLIHDRRPGCCEQAQAAVKAVNGELCDGTKLASFKTIEPKMAFINSLYRKLGMPECPEAAPLFASTTCTEGMTEEQFEALGEAEVNEQEPVEGDPEGRSVLERLEDPGEDDPGFDVEFEEVEDAADAEARRHVLHFSRDSVLAEGNALGAGVAGGGSTYTPEGTRHSTRHGGGRAARAWSPDTDGHEQPQQAGARYERHVDATQTVANIRAEQVCRR